MTIWDFKNNTEYKIAYSLFCAYNSIILIDNHTIVYNIHDINSFYQINLELYNKQQQPITNLNYLLLRFDTIALSYAHNKIIFARSKGWMGNQNIYYLNNNNEEISIYTSVNNFDLKKVFPIENNNIIILEECYETKRQPMSACSLNMNSFKKFYNFNIIIVNMNTLENRLVCNIEGEIKSAILLKNNNIAIVIIKK